MFGHSDKDNNQDNGADQGQPAQEVHPDDNNDNSWQHPGAPMDQPAPDQAQPADDGAALDAPAPEPINDFHAAPAPDFNAPAADPLPPAPAHSDNLIDDTPVDHDLVDIKQKALGQLTPLVGHLDQQPEDRFKTLMMMIQASDDQTLVKDAYEAAQSITDEKARAQALLDVVNEINYFTSQHQN
jgi:hypothetical protein